MAEKIEFSVKDAQGNQHVLTDDFLLQSMKNNGIPTVGVSEDGSSVMLPPPKPGAAPIERPWADVLQQQGFTVTGVKPLNADHDNVQLGWTAAMDSLTDDMEKRDYLGVKMRGLGHQDTKIIGQGNDWYAFNPASSQWVAVTNKPGLDATDFARVGLAAPRFLGSVVGGAAGAALGAATGPGAVASTALGAGLGGGAVETLKRGITALVDPDYKKVAGKNIGAQAKDIGIGSAWDAATMGLGKAIGPALRSLAPASTLARGAGTAAEGAGALTSKVGGFIAKSPVAADLLTSGVPGIGPANTLGWMARLPRDAIQGIPKAMEWGAGKIQGFAPELAKKMVGTGRQLGRGAEESFTQRGADWISRGLHGAPKARPPGAPPPPNAASVVRNMVGAAQRNPAAIAQNTAQRVAGRRLGDVAKEEAIRGAQRGVQGPIPMLSEETAAVAAKQAAQRGAAEKVGRVIDAIGAAGQGLTSATANTVRGLAGAAGGLGRATQFGGAGLRRLGTMAQPMEGLAYARAGTSELDKMIRDKLRRARHRATIEPMTYLASQEY